MSVNIFMTPCLSVPVSLSTKLLRWLRFPSFFTWRIHQGLVLKRASRIKLLTRRLKLDRDLTTQREFGANLQTFCRLLGYELPVNRGAGHYSALVLLVSFYKLWDWKAAINVYLLCQRTS